MIIETTMSIKHFCLALSLGLTLVGTISCNFSSEDIRRIARKEAGKDDFRDSEKWGKVVTKTLQMDEFINIDLQGSADIKFRQGEEFDVEVHGNEKAIAHYDISVADGTLTINHKKDTPLNVPSIKLTITAPDLKSINVSGAGDIELKDEAELSGNLTINISGAGDLDIERMKCQQLNIHISGAGDVTAEKIKCKKADINVSGAGDMKADLKANDINVEISGAGDADLDVKCQNLTVTAGGTGEIELKGECAHLTKKSGGMASIDSRKLAIHENIVIQ
jgi:cytoskeletal protein CcmA (bactofilin family)